ncbi:hypothetical protein MtrunA17_Chr2g0298471 [Medicago truncatula]|uniref:Uncharacterized protein n=1 Tax=Medicago truncatula TaxID=3880 RepID=A0A396JE46_MEDTR|nr:hypothetical protein MtrunA17_Chr2g0298471 [Medicago truncatula]
MKVWKFYLFFRSPSFLAFPVRFSCFPLLRFGCSSLFRFGAGFFCSGSTQAFLVPVRFWFSAPVRFSLFQICLDDDLCVWIDLRFFLF